MAAWTPSDLTNPSFVTTQLSAKDRSTALYSVNSELTSAKASLQSAAAALTIAQNAANNGPGRGEINALKAKANNPSLSPTEREQASQQAATLADQRDKLNVAAENALQKLNNANNYYDSLEQGKSNLLAAGTVEPGVNQFAAPPGYEGRSDPAAQVPNSQNPSATPVQTTEQLQNASPAYTTAQTNANASAATGAPVPVEKPATPELVPSGGGSIPYDELGNLNPGWEQDELGNPYYVGTDMVPKIAPELVPNGPTSDPYDELGNLNPGWGLDENNNPVWVKEGYIDATGENISDQKTVPNGPTSDPYDELGNLNPGWGLDENNNPVWVKEGYIDATGENISDQKTIPVGNIQGPPYDDEGNLMPGWSLDEDNNPVWVGNNADGSIFVEPATQASADASREAASGSRGLTAKQANTNSQATQQDVSNFKQKEDWRVRLSLAPSANYLYKVPKGSAGILEPLQATDGVIFPYTPQIQVNYQANYDPTDLTHSNYKIYQYRNSGVDSVSITCDFTAQDTYEANYLLAVIHFFKSVTKMFYGQDQNPKPGTPPPLCYLSGLGAFQFDAHPLAITSFNYSLPSDVDYIRAGAVTAGAGVNRSASNVVNNSPNVPNTRLGTLRPGGQAPAPIFSTPPGTVDPTYVPTKIQMTIGAVPVVTRNDISNNFSLEKYATGQLLRGTKRQGGGIW